jgi:hypothetical protein
VRNFRLIRSSEGIGWRKGFAASTQALFLNYPFILLHLPMDFDFLAIIYRDQNAVSKKQRNFSLSRYGVFGPPSCPADGDLSRFSAENAARTYHG